MRLVLWALAALAVAVLAGAVWFRVVPDDPATWHVDPLEARSTGKPNEARVAPPGVAGDIASPVFDLDAAALAARLDAVALAEPRTQRLARSGDGLFATYVQRSALWGFPDYVSVRAVDIGEGKSALAVWSRSRFGYSDLGVNRARLDRWLAAVRAD